MCSCQQTKITGLPASPITIRYACHTTQKFILDKYHRQMYVATSETISLCSIPWCDCRLSCQHLAADKDNRPASFSNYHEDVIFVLKTRCVLIIMMLLTFIEQICRTVWHPLDLRNVSDLLQLFGTWKHLAQKEVTLIFRATT